MTLIDARTDTGEDAGATGEGPPADARRRLPLWAHGLFGSIAALLVWSRAIHLKEPLWHDEAFALFAYVPDGPSAIMFGDYQINNHVFFELLSWATSQVTGTSEVSYRLWAFVPAVASAAWLASWLRSRVGPVAAAVFFALVTLAPLHLDLARQSRGYGLTYLAMAGLLVFGDNYNRWGRIRDVALFAVAGVVGVYTFPFFGIAFVLAGLALVVHRRRWKGVVVAGVLSGAVLLGLMAHAISRLRTTVGDFQVHDRIEVMGLGEIVLWPLRMIGPTFGFSVDAVDEIRKRMWEPTDWEILVVVLVVYPLLAVGALQLWRRDRRLGALLLVPLVGMFLVVTSLRLAVWERYTSYLIYAAVAVLAVGAEQVVRLARQPGVARSVALGWLALLSFPLSRALIGTRPAALVTAVLAAAALAVGASRRLPWRTGRALLGAGALAAALPLVTGFVTMTIDLGEPPRESWRAAADVVAELDDPTVATTRSAAASVYYLGPTDYRLRSLNGPFWIDAHKDTTQFLEEQEMNALFCNVAPPFVFAAPAMDLHAVDVSCLEQRGATRVSAPMVLFGGSLEVWTLR